MAALPTESGLRRRTTSTCDDITLAEVQALAARDRLASDLVFSVFASALKSYRCDTLVRPFPNYFRSEGAVEPDFGRLRDCMASVPSVTELTTATTVLDKDATALLGWLLQQPNLRFNSCPKEKYDAIQRESGKSSYKIAPDHIFEFQPAPGSKREADFAELGERHGSMLAYHGSALENFHSILMNGFLNHFNTTSLFGEGTYLSSDLSVCMGFCRAGPSWERSQLGLKLTIVAVCEVIKHPDVTLPGQIVQDGAESGQTLGGGKAPSTYVVVPNNDHLRLRYLFVYTEEAAAPESPEKRVVRRRGCCSGVWGAVARNRFALTMLGYFMGLVFLGLWNNRQFRRWVRRFKLFA